jgi:PAS domain S-box-containing protein
MDGDEGRTFIGVCHDITKRREAEKLSQRLGRILDNSFNEIYIFDAQTYRFSQISQGALNNLGYTMEEASHLTPWDLKPALDEESFVAMVEPLHRGDKEILIFETEHRRKDGSCYPVEVRLQLSRTETPPVFVAVIADITERKQAEEAIHAAKEQADVANRAKSEFLAAMSHELRTPLNAVLGFSEIMKEETLGPVGSVKYREYADDIHASGKHLLGLINDILDLSKIESGAEELHDDKIEVPELIHSALKLVGQRAGQEAVKLQVEISDQLPPLRADERKLKQILVNLLSNAIKFSDSGGEVALWAWCPMDSDSGHVFQIIDTGIGMAPEDIPKALSRFGQIDADLNRRYQGTGLGLPLTKALIELHGGTLDLQSHVGVGTIITVRFPVERIVRSPHDTEAEGAADRKTG